MSDPFSVTGTAVGIVSLSIQTFQILYKYCSDFKSFPRDVEAIQKQIRGLLGILEGLSEVKGRFEIDNHVPSSQLNMALKECEETLHELKTMAEKWNPTSPPEGVQAKVRVLKGRALWSYKKEDLKEMQSSLTRFQNNLSLALQCAGLDGAFRRLEDVRSELDTQRQQAIKIEQTLDQGTKALEMIRRDVASQSPALSTIYSEIVNLRTQLLESSGPRIDSCSLIESTSSSCELICEPSRMNNAPTQLEELQSSYKFEPRHDSTRTFPCRCRPRRKQELDSKGWYKVVTEETYDHRKDCPRSRHGVSTKSVAVQLSMYNSLVRFCVQIGWQHSRSRGWSWNAPAPVLRYRAVVSNDSPVFDLLERKTWEVIDIYERKENLGQITAILSNTTLQLRQMFGKTASSTDLDKDGNGILYAVLGLIYAVSGMYPAESAISELLDVCFEEGVPFEEPDADGHYPIVHWQLQTESLFFCNDELRKGIFHTLFHLIQKMKSWSVLQCGTNEGYKLPSPFFGSKVHILHDCISNLLKLESCSDGLHEDDPLREAILRRSERDFVTLMTAEGSDPYTLLHDDEYTYMLLSWPKGLQVLLSHIGKHIPQNILGDLLDLAITCSSPMSIEILLNHGATATFETWKCVAERLHNARYYQSLGMKIGLYGEEKEECSLWSKICDVIMSHLRPCHNVGAYDTINPGSGHTDVIPTALPIYHVKHLTVLLAESAWRSGHRELNSIIPDADYQGYYHATPFWLHATEVSSWDGYLSDIMKLFMWLMRHGADPFWMHPTYRTTPSHALARKVFAFEFSDDEYRESTLALLSSQVKDSCHCRCSRSGCRVIGCAVTRPREWSFPPDAPEQRQIFEKNLEGIFKIVRKEDSQRWMASDILRVMTFDELSLTHTCCYRFRDTWSWILTWTSPEEVEEVQDLERDDIDLLEQIVAELEEKWARYNKSFIAFMNRVWRPRMRKMHEDRKVDKASYQAELVRLGIILKESDQGRGSDVETDSDAESYESWPEENEDADNEGWYTTDEEADQA